MKKIGFATYQGIPGGTGDDLLAADELRRLGFDVVPVIWDDPAAATGRLDAVVIRSCWDYHLKPERFTAWLDELDQAGVTVLNSSRITRWNLNKEYLKDLAAGGVPVPRTIWIEPGSRVDLEDLLREHGMDEAVVKPVISLSAYKTWRTSTAQARAHQADFEEITAERAVMVQELVREVETQGEISFVFFGGEHSHTVLKRPKAGDFRVQEDFGGTREILTPSAALVEQAEAILDLAGEPVVFARVDAIDVGGWLVLMELELIDPFLFLGFDEGAPRRFAAAIAEAL